MSEPSGHWYMPDGTPMHFVKCKTREGTRPTNISDARKFGLLPGVTTILNTLNKPGLNDWKIKQAVYAVVTAPTLPGEDLDAKLVRVLETEQQQEQEAKIARDVGTQIHEALSLALSEKAWDHSVQSFVNPVVDWVKFEGKIVWTEKVLVNKKAGYAGRGDAMIDNPHALVLTDFKTCSKLPTKDSWIEHRLQTSAYASAEYKPNNKKIITCNVYISTKEPGQFAVFSQVDWEVTYVHGFLPILEYWKWAMNFNRGGVV